MLSAAAPNYLFRYIFSPRHATDSPLLPLPRRLETQGLRHYSFQGPSCAYLQEAQGRLAGPKIANGRVILAHLGNGASLVAVHQSRSLDSTMGFSPAVGLMISTRLGDLDPGVMSYLLQTEKVTIAQIIHLLNHKAGLRNERGRFAETPA